MTPENSTKLDHGPTDRNLSKKLTNSGERAANLGPDLSDRTSLIVFFTCFSRPPPSLVDCYYALECYEHVSSIFYDPRLLLFVHLSIEMLLPCLATRAPNC